MCETWSTTKGGKNFQSLKEKYPREYTDRKEIVSLAV